MMFFKRIGAAFSFLVGSFVVVLVTVSDISAATQPNYPKTIIYSANCLPNVTCSSCTYGSYGDRNGNQTCWATKCDPSSVAFKTCVGGGSNCNQLYGATQAECTGCKGWICGTDIQGCTTCACSGPNAWGGMNGLNWSTWAPCF